MSSPKFYETRMGIRFYQHQVPELTTSLNKVAEELKRSNDLKEEELAELKRANDLKSKELELQWNYKEPKSESDSHE